ncbi:MAG TPA: hypothetical protein VKD71_04725 [Gemmataceae bacterium]|nr:hypothetical protein [Gemmataceae bacterium]
MRRFLFVAAFLGLFFGSSQVSNAQAIRTGPEANEYLFIFYAIDDMMREFRLDQIEMIRANSEATVYADRIGALLAKRRLILNSFRRHAEITKLDKQGYDAIEETNNFLRTVGAYYEKLKAAQDHYDLGFRQIQAKLFTDAELREKLLQSFIDAESFYLNNVGSTAAGRRLSDDTLRGITRSLKRRAVAEYQLSKTKQKLAEDVHKACLKYEEENRPALEAKIEGIHREFATDYEEQYKQAVQNITGKFRPLAGKMGISEAQVIMIASRKDFDWARDGADRTKDPFRYISAARKMKVETSEDAKNAHEFSRECLKAIELIPSGDSRDSSEVFFYYRGLLCGWAATLATKAAAIQIGSDSLDKAYRYPAEAAATALYAWNRYKSYDKSMAFSRQHVVINTVYAMAYQGKVQEALKFAKDASGERIDDPNYWYVLARLCGVYKFGNTKNIESFYEQGTQHMREAMLLGFTGVEEAKIHPDFDSMRKNSKIAAKLNNAMFEPDNLFKLTKVSEGAKKN